MDGSPGVNSAAVHSRGIGASFHVGVKGIRSEIQECGFTLRRIYSS